MNFELGKEYIVKVSKEGIIPIEEFRSDRFFDIESSDLDFLTDEEKTLVINDVLDKINTEIKQVENEIIIDDKDLDEGKRIAFEYVHEIIDKYIEGSKNE